MVQQIKVKLGRTVEGRGALVWFARYCAGRLERELGAVDGWEVSVARLAGEHAATVHARVGGRTIASGEFGRDPTLAIWNAMCRIEQPLRDALRPAHAA